MISPKKKKEMKIKNNLEKRLKINYFYEICLKYFKIYKFFYNKKQLQ